MGCAECHPTNTLLDIKTAAVTLCDVGRKLEPESSHDPGALPGGIVALVSHAVAQASDVLSTRGDYVLGCDFGKADRLFQFGIRWQTCGVNCLK